MADFKESNSVPCELLVEFLNAGAEQLAEHGLFDEVYSHLKHIAEMCGRAGIAPNKSAASLKAVKKEKRERLEIVMKFAEIRNQIAGWKDTAPKPRVIDGQMFVEVEVWVNDNEHPGFQTVEMNRQQYTELTGKKLPDLYGRVRFFTSWGRPTVFRSSYDKTVYALTARDGYDKVHYSTHRVQPGDYIAYFSKIVHWGPDGYASTAEKPILLQVPIDGIKETGDATEGENTKLLEVADVNGEIAAAVEKLGQFFAGFPQEYTPLDQEIMANIPRFVANCEHVARWNQFRKEHPDMVINLSGLNFSGVRLSHMDLSGVNFTGTDLRTANLSYAKLSGAKLDGAKLDGALLQGTELEGSGLNGGIEWKGYCRYSSYYQENFGRPCGAPSSFPSHYC